MSQEEKESVRTIDTIINNIFFTHRTSFEKISINIFRISADTMIVHIGRYKDYFLLTVRLRNVDGNCHILYRYTVSYFFGSRHLKEGGDFFIKTLSVPLRPPF